MSETIQNESNQPSDADIEAAWKKAFPDKEMSSDFTIEMKRAVLEIRKHEIAQLSDEDIDALWQKTITKKKISDLIIDLKRAVLGVIQWKPERLVTARKYTEAAKDRKPSRFPPFGYRHDVVRGIVVD